MIVWNDQHLGIQHTHSHVHKTRCLDGRFGVGAVSTESGAA